MKIRKRIEIANTCVKAIYDSQKIYSKMSGGDWLSCAPEYFLTSMIALGLKDKISNIYITLENSTTEALKEAEAIKPSKVKKLHKDIRAKGKVDLLIWDKKFWPVGVIEVKNNCWANREIKKDFARIKEILKLGNKSKNSSLEFGIFTYYYSLFKGKNKASEVKLKSKEDTIEEIMSNVFDDNYTKRIFKKISKKDKDGDLWGAFSVLVYKN